MSAVMPFTTGDGNEPMGKEPSSKDARNAQFACASAVRNAGTTVLKSGLFDTLIPVFQAWKQ